MNILLISAYFPPDVGSTATLYRQLGAELVDRGHSVTVLTTIPRYNPLGDLSKYSGRRWMRERTDDGLDVLRIDVPTPPRKHVAGRAVWQLGVSFGIAAAGLLRERHDVALVYSPPLPLGTTALAIRRAKGTPFVFGVQDLFPQSVVDLGLLKSRLLIRLSEIAERLVYKRADALTAHSQANADHLIAKGARADRVHVVPNWVDTGALAPSESGEAFKQRHGVSGRFVVSFAGVLGWSQDVDIVLDAAAALREHTDIEWLIIGDGVRKDGAVRKSRDMRLANVKFLPMLPPAEYAESLSASDVCLATLVEDVKTPVVPSKILSIMGAGKPVLGAMNKGGDAPKLIFESRSGYVVPAGDHETLAQAVLDLTSDPARRRRLGENGRKYAEEHLSVQAAAQRYLAIFETIA